MRNVARVALIAVAASALSACDGIDWAGPGWYLEMLWQTSDGVDHKALLEGPFGDQQDCLQAKANAEQEHDASSSGASFFCHYEGNAP